MTYRIIHTRCASGSIVLSCIIAGDYAPAGRVWCACLDHCVSDLMWMRLCTIASLQFIIMSYYCPLDVLCPRSRSPPLPIALSGMQMHITLLSFTYDPMELLHCQVIFSESTPFWGADKGMHSKGGPVHFKGRGARDPLSEANWVMSSNRLGCQPDRGTGRH